jgi:endonuclease G
MSEVAEKIVSFLEEYKVRDISEALASIRDGMPAPQPKSEDIDVGPPLGVGEENRVELADLGFIERIIPPEVNLLPVHFLTEGAIVQRAVGKVTVSPPGWVGTGCMVSPTLFLTNNHVIRNTTDANNTRVRFNFQYDHNGDDQPVDEFQADPVSFLHTNPSLDYTLVRLKSKPILYRKWPYAMRAYPEFETMRGMGQLENAMQQAPTMPAGEFFNEEVDVRRIDTLRWPTYSAGSRWGYIRMRINTNYAQGQRLNVIQHPRGRRKEVAVQDNTITTIHQNHIRYTTDTDPGSSGSPVLNNSWEFVVLHHAAGSKDASGQWQDNQGVRIDKIAQDLRTELSGSTSGQAILSELGL